MEPISAAQRLGQNARDHNPGFNDLPSPKHFLRREEGLLLSVELEEEDRNFK
jgi:hypothetical protein